jgi:cell division protein FtsI (penicillin-binding protein 3)
MILAPLKGAPELIQLQNAERGPILDRNGKILALTTRMDSVAVWIPGVEDPAQTADLLGDIQSLGTSEEILALLRKHSGFTFIKRKISPTESERVRYLLSKQELSGVEIVPEYGRIYPHAELASHALGFVGVDNSGLTGIEYTFNSELSPTAWNTRPVGNAGNQIILSLDINIQHIIESIALGAYEDTGADSMIVVVVQAHTGEILGYSALPRFDPNEYSAVPESFRLNIPALHAYEPGSVFKIFSLSGLVELGAVDLKDTFPCNGYYEKRLPDDRSIRIRCLRVHGNVGIKEILKYSCNAGAAYASDREEAESFFYMLRLFGFGSPTGAPFPGETAGILSPPSEWSARTKPTIAIGQEIAVSALQIVTAASAIANDGVLLQPLLVRKIVTAEGELLKEYKRKTVRRVLSPELARQILRVMQGSTEEDGTARLARIEGVRLSAKTGTAQVPDSESNSYSKNEFVASILGIFPTEKPELILYVVIFNPKGQHYFGSQVASPVFKKIAERLVDYWGIEREGHTVLAHPGVASVTIPAPIELGDFMPDLLGVSKRSLLPLLQRDDLKVLIAGEGHVMEQSPPPGTPLGSGQSLILKLE